MRLLSFLDLLALAVPAFAQNNTNITAPIPPEIIVSEVPVQSAPFRLQLQSHNRTLNNSFLSAVHEGAALEALGIYPASWLPDTQNTFKLNTTRIVCTYVNGTELPCDDGSSINTTTSIGEPGILTWDLPYEGSTNDTVVSYISQAMKLVPRGVSSNIAFPVIFFLDEDDEFNSVAFDSNGYMNLQDDLNRPREAVPFGVSVAYYRWHVCYIYFESYLWSHLVWVAGSGEPDVPHCDKVDVKRVFV